MSTFTTIPETNRSREDRTFTMQQVLRNCDVAFLHGCTIRQAVEVKRKVLEKFGKLPEATNHKGRPKDCPKIAYWQYKETFGV